MTEREKVLLQREAVRRWYQYCADPDRPDGEDEAALRRLFPLPPRREPRVACEGPLRYRVSLDGKLQFQWHGETSWIDYPSGAAILTVAASPYIEVPDPEDQG